MVNDFDNITLEPGSQFELSSKPEKSIHSLAKKIIVYNSLSSKIAEELGIYWLGYGIQPVSTYENIELIPKSRYEIMTEYLPTKGSRALVMMRETAGIQVSLDYKSEYDAIAKLRASLLLSPIVSAIFSNSPVREGKDTGFKSYRAYSWLYTDNDRCGLVSRLIFESNYEYSFSDYTDALLDLPMMFLKKDDKWINMRGITFRDYLKNGYNNCKATIEDWYLHMSSFFPDVRLRNYIEIRNCDSQKSDLIPSVPALWKGILYNNDAMAASLNLVNGLSWEDINELKNLTPKYALEAEIKGIKLKDIAKELVNIAENSLKSLAELNEKNQDESIYLENLKKLVSKGKTPSNIILEHWYADWNKDINKLIYYSRLG